MPPGPIGRDTDDIRDEEDQNKTTFCLIRVILVFILFIRVRLELNLVTGTVT